MHLSTSIMALCPWLIKIKQVRNLLWEQVVKTKGSRISQILWWMLHKQHHPQTSTFQMNLQTSSATTATPTSLTTEDISNNSTLILLNHHNHQDLWIPKWWRISKIFKTREEHKDLVQFRIKQILYKTTWEMVKVKLISGVLLYQTQELGTMLSTEARYKVHPSTVSTINIFNKVKAVLIIHITSTKSSACNQERWVYQTKLPWQDKEKICTNYKVISSRMLFTLEDEIKLNNENYIWNS